MLVDGAIVTPELGDRKLQEGAPPREAFAHAAKRTAWPIIASTLSTLSVFFPLLFSQGMVDEFMKFLPITVILTLTASLFIALVFNGRRDRRGLPGADCRHRRCRRAGAERVCRPVLQQARQPARDPEVQAATVGDVCKAMDRISGFTDVGDTRPLPGVERGIRVNRSEAARSGAGVSLLGQAIQLLTQGITVADCQDDADATLNIRVRFPADERPLEVIFPRSGGRGQSAIRSIFGQ